MEKPREIETATAIRDKYTRNDIVAKDVERSNSQVRRKRHHQKKAERKRGAISESRGRDVYISLFIRKRR